MVILNHICGRMYNAYLNTQVNFFIFIEISFSCVIRFLFGSDWIPKEKIESVLLEILTDAQVR